MPAPPLGWRRRLLAVVTVMLAGAAAAPSPASALDRAGYLALADRLQVHLDAYWNEALGRYDPGVGATTTQVNADLLLAHAVAARYGHHGRARDDRRARLVARFLTGPAAWTERPLPGADPRITGPGWRASPDHPGMHAVFVSEAAEGVAQAYAARAALDLDETTVAAIRDQVARTAAGPDWRWPALIQNQFNWYCAVFAADALVNGARTALARGMGRHLDQFLAGAAGNFGPGLRFNYLPGRPPETYINFDSAEYANIVLGFSRFYGQARRAGMQPPARMALLRAWVRRAIAGYWTHAGYLNWDTGLGFHRWHQRKKVPLGQQALLGIAATRELQPGAQWGGWAKWLLDRGLQLYTDLADREGGVPAALAYGVDVLPQLPGNAVLAAARTSANAMRALAAGLGDVPARRPPALYSYDPDTGRLAVTTPRYNTAIVAVNRGAFPYGGLDIARLFDGRQAVAASIGGVPPASFGLRVRAAGGRVLLATQYGSRSPRRGGPPLRLTRAPRGVGASLTARAAYAGPFTDLRVRGSVSAGGRRATSAYRFTPQRARGRPGRCRAGRAGPPP